MRLAVAIEYLDAPNGAATYAHTLGAHLQRLGHETTMVAQHLGALAALVRESGIPVAQDLSEAPDVVIAQDPMIALDLAQRWPRTPQVYVAHGAELDQGMPPTTPGVTAAAVAMNDRVAQRLAGHAAIPRVVRLRQPVDAQRFRRRGPASPESRRVLLLGNYLQGARRDAIHAACEAAGLESFCIGEHGTPTVAPEDAIATADIVIGYGRSILEAMACGRGVYVLDEVSADGWVTPDRYDALERNGFAGTAFPVSFSPASLTADLGGYAAEMGEANRDLILRHHGAHGHASSVAQLCAEVGEHAPHYRRDPPPEAARLARLTWNAEWRLHQRAAQLAAADERATELERRVAVAERRAADATARLEEFRRTRRYRIARALGQPLDLLRRAKRAR